LSANVVSPLLGAIVLVILPAHVVLLAAVGPGADGAGSSTDAFVG